GPRYAVTADALGSTGTGRARLGRTRGRSEYIAQVHKRRSSTEKHECNQCLAVASANPATPTSHAWLGAPSDCRWRWYQAARQAAPVIQISSRFLKHSFVSPRERQ